LTEGLLDEHPATVVGTRVMIDNARRCRRARI
jgi:hypothetical protein